MAEAAGVERIPYDEFGLFHENASEFGLPYDGPPTVRRDEVEVEPGRKLSVLVWGTADPEYVLIHGGSQNAHTWDTVAMAMGKPLIAIDLPGHGHSDGPGDRPDGQLSAVGNAEDVAVVIRTLAPNAKAVIGMSLGGLTTIALTGVAPELVRKVVLVDITPGVKPERSKQIGDFVNGPTSFPSFKEILERTMQFNPTRSESSMRRGILHNAEQQPDGSWVWRYMRFRAGVGGGQQSEAARAAAAQAAPASGTAEQAMFGDLWEVVGNIKVPLLLARGMRSQSVIDDDNEAELLKRLPSATVEHFDDAGHSVQGDMPLELAASILRFAG